ncbi:sialidase family protein [Pollutibacter soli]|uniref:sialidase family protein n=1 Tax=Pollutibacter soli TaxID=3034157 RepID=UPI003013F626
MNFLTSRWKRVSFYLLFFLLIYVTGTSAFAQKAFTDSSLVFDPGEKFATVRIPALVMTNKGSLLAFAEGRLNGHGDWAAIDILLRRSTDGGKTWGDVITLVEHDSKNTPTSNATPIVDKDGTIHFLYQRNYDHAYYIKSTDDGNTWSEPIDITYVFETFRKDYNWKVIAPGPGHAIQLKNGRLLVPVWLCEPDKSRPGGDHRPSCIATIYSDDHGATWKRGDIVVNNGDTVQGIRVVNPSENVAIELADGRVLLNMRTESVNHERLIAYSKDGATGWTKPVFDPELYDPVCMASLIRVSGVPKGKTRILFVNPDTKNDTTVVNKNNFRKRENITAFMSYDEGETWPVKKSLFPGISGYSDLAAGKDGTIYCLYERRDSSEGVGYSKFKVVLKKFNVAWLTDGKDK